MSSPGRESARLGRPSPSDAEPGRRPLADSLALVPFVPRPPGFSHDGRDQVRECRNPRPTSPGSDSVPTRTAVREDRTATREHQRIAQIHDDIAGWRRWGPYVGDRSWATVREDYSATATPGAISPTTSPAARPTAGARTASPAIATATSSSASPPPSGTDATRSSRNASSASLPTKATTARTSRNTTSTSTTRPPTLTPVSLQVSPGRVPLPAPHRREPPTRRPGVRVRAARHRRLR